MSRDLSTSEIVLVDIDGGKLDSSYRLAKKYNSAAGGKLNVKKSGRIKEALQDCDFVINTVLAGAGHTLQERVRSVSQSLGYYRGIESTEFNMVSDYATTFAGYDQLKYALELQKYIHDMARDAWLINIANPMFELQTMLLRENLIKSVSYCDGTLHGRQIAGFFGLDPDASDFQVAGINHNIWLTRLRSEGEDQYPGIEKWIEKSSERYWTSNPFYRRFDPNISKDDISANVQFSRVAVDMWEQYGLFPVGDTVRSGTWKYHYDLETKKRWYGPYGGFDSEIGWNAYLRQLGANNARIRRLAEKGDSELLREIPMTMSHDPIIPFIEAILFDKKLRAHLNVRNDDVISGLPENLAVEVSVAVDRRGIHPEKIVRLNDRIVKGFLMPRVTKMELALDAFYSGSKDVLLDIIHRDVRTRSDEQASTVLEKILRIPGNAAALKHYR